MLRVHPPSTPEIRRGPSLRNVEPELTVQDVLEANTPQSLVQLSQRLETLKKQQPEQHHWDFHASPLMPMQGRDDVALAGFFRRDDMEEICVNIQELLQILFPAPCWEDDPFDFLEGYIWPTAIFLE